MYLHIMYMSTGYPKTHVCVHLQQDTQIDTQTLIYTFIFSYTLDNSSKPNAAAGYPNRHVNTYLFAHSYFDTHSTIAKSQRQVGEDSLDALKLQVIFCKRATNYRALLRKMTCEDKASYESTPPCTNVWQRRNTKNRHLPDARWIWKLLNPKP